MKKFIIVALLAILTTGHASDPNDIQDVSQNIQYTVDRIEIGVEGEQWVVIEVYDANTDTITMMNVKIEEGYKVK